MRSNSKYNRDFNQNTYEPIQLNRGRWKIQIFKFGFIRFQKIVRYPSNWTFRFIKFHKIVRMKIEFIRIERKDTLVPRLSAPQLSASFTLDSACPSPQAPNEPPKSRSPTL